ncbi:MAG TPA: hypothetical protein VLU46_08640 [Thermoanaerobaculia bacterium]|nr:hypothetical protein [Thermoanaerobaculia bacterium]
MRLTSGEMQLLVGACADHGNDAAQQLLNLFAVQAADELLILIPTIPIGLLAEITAHLWRAVNHEYRKRTGCDLVFVEETVA